MIIEFCTGCGGTGKSHLIMFVSKWVEKILINPGPVKPKVLLLAFTGVASSLIGNENTFRIIFRNFVGTS